MKPRSPVLGYNHNVRYAERLWHVQTEDSGVQNPHIFTHLFHDGTILATKRIDYDPSSDVGVVQKLMQAQHKAMLRDLKAGAFDDKITRFFGAPVVKEREDQTDPGASISGEFDTAPKTDPSIPPLPAPSSASSSSSVPQQPPARVVQPSTPLQPAARTASSSQMAHAATQQAPQAPKEQPSLTRPSSSPQAPGSRTSVPQPPSPTRPNLTPARPSIPVAASRTGQVPASAPRAPVTGIGGRRSGSGVAHPYGGGKPTAEGVVVARPAVIVGDPQGTAPRGSVGQRQRSFTPPPPQASAPPPQPAQVQASKTPTSDNIFGGDLISEKSLDEVILAYLSEDLNEK